MTSCYAVTPASIGFEPKACCWGVSLTLGEPTVALPLCVCPSHSGWVTTVVTLAVVSQQSSWPGPPRAGIFPLGLVYTLTLRFDKKY